MKLTLQLSTSSFNKQTQLKPLHVNFKLQPQTSTSIKCHRSYIKCFTSNLQHKAENFWKHKVPKNEMYNRTKERKWSGMVTTRVADCN